MYYTRVQLIAVVFLAGFVSRAALAFGDIVTVEYYNSSGTLVNDSDFPAGPGIPVPVALQNNHTGVRIFATPSTASIGRIEISGSGQGSTITVKLTKDVFNAAIIDFPNTAGCGDLGGICEVVDDTARTVLFMGNISGDLVGEIGDGGPCGDATDYLDSIAFFRIGGAVQASITADAVANVEAESISSAGDIRMREDGLIVRIAARTGDILGDIIAENAWVRNVEANFVPGQDIGAPGAPVTILSQTVPFFQSSGIRLIGTTGDIYANIDTHGDVTVADKGIQFLRCEGDFHGSLKASTFATDFFIDGSLFGILNFSEAQPNDVDLRIGDSIESTGEINIDDPNGVPNVIVVNQMNAGR